MARTYRHRIAGIDVGDAGRELQAARLRQQEAAERHRLIGQRFGIPERLVTALLDGLCQFDDLASVEPVGRAPDSEAALLHDVLLCLRIGGATSLPPSLRAAGEATQGGRRGVGAPALSCFVASLLAMTERDLNPAPPRSAARRWTTPPPRQYRRASRRPAAPAVSRHRPAYPLQSHHPEQVR